jgi:hypothetical protein
MSRKLFIHAGTPKTGSSFLQSVFHKSAKRLNDCGILYPGVNHGIYQSTANVDINGQLLTKIVIYKTLEQLLEIKIDLIEMVRSLFSLGKDKVFLSDETLGIVNSDVWGVLNDVCLLLNIKLIVFSYYRQPEKYYPSHWAQLVRNHGEVKSLIEFANSTNLQVWRNILAIREQVNCTYVFSYELELKAKSTLLDSAAKVLGISPDEFVDNGESNVNPSLSLNALTAIRLINDEYGMEAGKKLNVQLTSQKADIKKLKPRLPLVNEKMIFERHYDEIEQCIALYNESVIN